jgi:hypothetical protein
VLPGVQYKQYLSEKYLHNGLKFETKTLPTVDIEVCDIIGEVSFAVKKSQV